MAVAVPEQDQRADRIALALEMLNLGFRLFPLYPRSKNPMTKAGFKDATDDPKKVVTFLNHAGITGYGMVAPENVIEWDIDGPDWRQSMAQMTEQWGKPGSTLRTKSPHGFHLFYEVDPAVMALPGSKMLGFVCRKTGEHGKGYVVGPGSVVDDPETGETDLIYTREGASTIAKLPRAWQNAALAEHQQHLKPVNAPLITVSEAGGYVAPTSVAPGGRYEAIRAYTAHLYNAGNTPDEMWALVQSVLAPVFTEPYPGNGLRERFNRAIRDMDKNLGAPSHTLKAARPAKPTVEELKQAGRALGAYETSKLKTFDAYEMEWAWYGWLPKRMVTILDGNPGEGKSTIVADLVSRITTGRDWPDGEPGGDPGTVLYITVEDDPNTALHPRVLAAEGDPERIEFLEAEMMLPRDAGRLEDLAMRLKPDLIVIDPLFSHVDDTVVSTISDTSMRHNIMEPLQKIASAADCAILILRHYNKSGTGSAMQRGSGSLGGIAGAARSTWGVVDDPDDDEGERRVFGPVKTSYSGKHPAMKYLIEGVVLPGWKQSVSRVKWVGKSLQSVNDIMMDQNPERTRAVVARLREVLANGPLTKKEVLAAMAAGKPSYSQSTVYRARKQANVSSGRTEFGGEAIWSLNDVKLNVPRAGARARGGPHGENVEKVAPSGTFRDVFTHDDEPEQDTEVELWPDEDA